jgi:hypothetical protein
MTTTENPSTGSNSDLPVDGTLGRPRFRRWVGIVGTFAVFAGTLGYVTGNEVQANTQFDQTHRSLDATRQRIASVGHALTVVRHDLDVVNGQVAVDSTTLANDTTKLDGARTALVNAQANVTQQSSATVNLHTCLGGVERALNALALGDPNGAVGALTAVAGSCSSAVTAGG